MIWLFLWIEGALCGCPSNESPTILGSLLGPLIFCTPISRFASDCQYDFGTEGGATDDGNS